MSGQWGWGTAPEAIDGREDTREDAIAAAREEAEPGATVYVWAHLRDPKPSDYVDVEADIVDSMGNRAYDDQPECYDDQWPADELTSEAIAELDSMVKAWADKHLSVPWFIADSDAEEIPPEET